MTAPPSPSASPDQALARARALGAPTRAAIVAYLADADTDEPVTVAALTDHLGLNHTAVRKHLNQLVAAGLVREERERRVTPGRPRLLYRLDPSAEQAAERPYERLAVMLATALATGDDPADVGRRAAAVAAPAAPSSAPIAPSSAPPLDALSARFEAEGFAPTVERTGRRTELVLGRCPFAAAAEANPDVVCRLHLGMAEGAAAAIGGIEVDRLVPHHPRRAGCRLLVS